MRGWRGEMALQLIVYLRKRVPIMIFENPLQRKHKNLSTSSSSALVILHFLSQVFIPRATTLEKLNINFDVCSFSTLMLPSSPLPLWIAENLCENRKKFYRAVDSREENLHFNFLFLLFS